MQTSRFKLGARLGASFFLVIMLTLAIGGFALRQISVVFNDVEEIATNWLPSISILEDLRIQANRARHLEADLLLSRPEQRPGIVQSMEKVERDLSAAQDKYAPLISSSEEKEGYAQYLTLRDAYARANAKLVQLVANNADIPASAISFYAGDSKSAYDAFAAQANALIEINTKGAAASHEDAKTTYSGAKLQVSALAALAVLLGSALAWWMTRQIVRPINEAVQAAERIAGGDLSQEMHCKGKDEIAHLLQALANMQQQLAATVREVRRNADSVATASAEIAQGNQDLSSRTEEQASALEQTAASMEQLGTTVQQNADHAREASSVANQAANTATQGGAVVQEVVTRMQGINAASQKISEIIGVIDGIAFQTNILALNAAVEAARAGEQGRGFSVVAAEVRVLAQRSAEASRQVKTLVEGSVQEVARGSALVDQAGSTMREVVAAIEHVAQLVNGISAATSEQSAGVAQVGEAVAQMDQATQQNAALVEESAAAADSLSTQAAQLVQSVAVFRLNDAPSHDTPPTARQSQERRGPTRATNVLRPEFSKKFSSAPATIATKAPERTGSDDWTSF